MVTPVTSDPEPCQLGFSGVIVQKSIEKAACFPWPLSYNRWPLEASEEATDTSRVSASDKQLCGGELEGVIRASPWNFIPFQL